MAASIIGGNDRFAVEAETNSPLADNGFIDGCMDGTPVSASNCSSPMGLRALLLLQAALQLRQGYFELTRHETLGVAIDDVNGVVFAQRDGVLDAGVATTDDDDVLL